MLAPLLASCALVLAAAVAAPLPVAAADAGVAGDALPESAPAAPWSSVLLDTSTGAVALDGTPARLYLRAGAGASAANVILFFEGGGWCESLADCAARADTALGSSKFNSSGYAARDVLQPNCTANPTFCGWSMVYAQYLDGTSRAGDVAAPVAAGRPGQEIFFRGARVLRATLDALLAPGGPGARVPSLAAAPRVLVTGSSAGGLTTFLHIDEIARAVRAANAGADVRALPEVGWVRAPRARGGPAAREHCALTSPSPQLFYRRRVHLGRRATHDGCVRENCEFFQHHGRRAARRQRSVRRRDARRRALAMLHGAIHAAAHHDAHVCHQLDG